MDRFTQLLVDVDAAFEVTSRGLHQWADPHPDRSPLDEEYSRLLDPAKWRIIGARVDAWVEALVATGLAVVELGVEVAWVETPTSLTYRTDRLSPRRPGTLSLVIARSRIDGVDDVGVTLGAGDPAVVVEIIPDCGCDACDSGSQDVLDQVDDCIGSIVRGEFRHLWRRVERPPRPAGFWYTTPPEPAARVDDVPFAETWALPDLETIMVRSDGRRSAHNVGNRVDIDAVLADPSGWHETTGAPWIGE